MRKLSVAFAAAAALSMTAPALADPAPIILTEDFESGGFGVFTATGQVGVATGADYQLCCSTTGNTTNHFAAFGSGQLPSGLISSPLNLIAGESYTLTFDYSGLGAGTDPLHGSVGGLSFTTSKAADNNLDTTFQTFSFTYTELLGGPTTLQFYSDGIPNVDAILDNITFSGLAAPSAVPEPATWAMMLLGFGAVGFTLRRKNALPALA